MNKKKSNNRQEGKKNENTGKEKGKKGTGAVKWFHYLFIYLFTTILALWSSPSLRGFCALVITGSLLHTFVPCVVLGLKALSKTVARLLFASDKSTFFPVIFAFKDDPRVMALLQFLWQHADVAVLDALAMAQLQALVPPALVARPDLQRVLELYVRRFSNFLPESVFSWTTARGFARPLSREQVHALTQLLMLQVLLSLFPCHCVSCQLKALGGSSFFFLVLVLV